MCCRIACRHANTRHQSFAGPAANAMAEQMNEFRGPLGAARQRRSHFMHLLDKRLSLACFVMASPASHAKLDDHSHPLVPASLADDPHASRDDALTACRSRDPSPSAKIIQWPSIRSAPKILTPSPGAHPDFVSIQ
jgi:hypothetical protein